MEVISVHFYALSQKEMSKHCSGIVWRVYNGSCFCAHNQCILLYLKLRFKKLCEMFTTAHEMQIYKFVCHRLFDMAYTILS